MLEKIRNAINERDGFSSLLGIVVEELKPGYAKAVLNLEKQHLNGYGNVHGGVSFTLADMAFGGVALSSNISTVNLSSNITYTKAGKVGPLTAIGRLVSESRKVCTIEVHVTDGTGALIAVMMGTGYRMTGPFVSEEV